MAHIDPTLPGHVAQAYGVARASRPLTVTPLRHADDATAARLVRPSASRLVAGTVPGGIDFTVDGPVSTGGSIPMYRHPADRNAAAVSIHAGRMIDVRG